MKKIIAVCNDQYILLGCISVRDDELIYTSLLGKGGQDIENMVETFRGREFSVLKESFGENGNVAARVEPVQKSHPGYLDAIARELRGRGIRAFLIPAEAKEILMRLGNGTMTAEERKNAIGDILYAPDEEMKEIAAFVNKLSELEKQL